MDGKSSLAKQGHAAEIESLNADDLSVEELERRLELAVAVPLDLLLMDEWSCSTFDCGSMRGCSYLQSCSGFTCGPLRGGEEMLLQ